MKKLEKFFIYRMLYYGINTFFLLRPTSYFKALQLWAGRLNEVSQYTLWNGTEFFLRPNTADFNTCMEIYIRKVYDFVELPKNAIVLDLGAHIGLFSLWCSTQTSNAQICAYEPSDENFAILQKNIQLNGLQKNIKSIKNAVYHKHIQKNLFVTRDTVCNSLYPSFNKDITTVKEVTCVTLEEIFEKNNIEKCDLLKLDIEGAEYDVLQHTPIRIFDRIKAIVIEYHREPDELKKILSRNGFDITVVPGMPGYSASFIYAKR